VEKNVEYHFISVNYAGTFIDSSVTAALNCLPLSDSSVQFGTFNIPDSSISIKYIVKTTSEINQQNDSVIRIQNFQNYYAYDDGTAEKGYGLLGVGSKLAYRFQLNQPDTLRAVQIHFAHIDADVRKKLFSVMVWKTLTPESIIYEQDFQKPTYVDSLNGFYTYVLDTPKAISDIFYIGWLQTYPDLLNVGLDRNTDSHQNLFYNLSGEWTGSSVNGSVMIRPVIGNKLPVLASASLISPVTTFSLYPNPVENMLMMRFDREVKGSYKILDCMGRTLLQSNELAEKMDVSSLSDGMYFLQIREKQSGRISVQKFIKL
jgi:hypothetical protein